MLSSGSQGRLSMSENNRDECCYGIADLAERGGVTRRTVRYYVQRGLLPAPLGTGRGPHYTLTHLERLIHIRQLQERGVPLAEIAVRLDGASPTLESASEAPPERSTWTRFVLTDGVELHVRTGTMDIPLAQLARLVEATQQTLGLRTAPHLSVRSNSHERN